MTIKLPQNVEYIINQLMKHGYDAYAVGGCVRDSILGKTPKDWDITTSAKPLDIKRIFRRTVDTGIQHGTVTVMLEKEGYEVTTYRIDGEYKDNRRPKSVLFTSDLTQDLKRRDFTINAMAYNDNCGLVDVFGGLKDIKERTIRCVGSASERFDEDALRILRAVRFSAWLGFDIDKDTLDAIKGKADNLMNISAERIREELNKLLLSDHPDKLLLAYEQGITRVVLPEFDRMLNTDQNNPHHIYNVGMHSLKAVESVDKNLVLRFTMLLHDVSKPDCKITDEKGVDHFYGHPEKSSKLAKDILRRLKFDNETIDMVTRLIKWHDYRFTLTESKMRKAINKIGMDIMDKLFEVKRADILSQNPSTWDEKLDNLKGAIRIYHEIKNKNQCTDLKMLNINGKDLIEIGYKPGIKIGEVLNYLLEQVLDNPDLNDKEILINLAQNYTP